MIKFDWHHAVFLHFKVKKTSNCTGILNRNACIYVHLTDTILCGLKLFLQKLQTRSAISNYSHEVLWVTSKKPHLLFPSSHQGPSPICILAKTDQRTMALLWQQQCSNTPGEKKKKHRSSTGMCSQPPPVFPLLYSLFTHSQSKYHLQVCWGHHNPRPPHWWRWESLQGWVVQ